MSITLQGLTRQQYQIADLLWNCDTQAQVQTLIHSMPPQHKQDAETIYELMIAAVMDQHTEITEDVKDIISRICS